MIVRTFIFALTVAACAPPDPGGNQMANASAPGPASIAAPVATLEGQWRAIRADGKPVELALSISGEEIWWEPRCAGYVRSYRIAGSEFETGPHIGFVPRQPGEPTPPVCAIAPPPDIGAVFKSLDAATSIRRTRDNGIELAGGGHSLLLFSQ